MAMYSAGSCQNIINISVKGMGLDARLGVLQITLSYHESLVTIALGQAWDRSLKGNIPTHKPSAWLRCAGTQTRTHTQCTVSGGALPNAFEIMRPEEMSELIQKS